MKLSERLEFAAWAVDGLGQGNSVAETIREAAELARRVEGAACVTVQEALFPDDYRCGKLIATTPETLIGQRVRIVPEQGEGGWDG